MYKFQLIIFTLLLGCFQLEAQCDLALDEVDDFDSTRVISAAPISIGNIIPSLFETVDGPLFIDEAKIMFTFSENDSIKSFFITLAIPEYEYQPVEKDYNVYLKLSDGGVVRLYNVPDRGTFDRHTNMRLYQHTIVVPLDLFSRFTFSFIEKIRVAYKFQNRDFEITPEQQKAIREAVQCVGRATELYPVKP